MVTEEYETAVMLVDEAYTSSKCPVYDKGCGKRIESSGINPQQGEI
jgi:hypothetical protein